MFPFTRISFDFRRALPYSCVEYGLGVMMVIRKAEGRRLPACPPPSSSVFLGDQVPFVYDKALAVPLTKRQLGAKMETREEGRAGKEGCPTASWSFFFITIAYDAIPFATRLAESDKDDKHYDNALYRDRLK